MRLFILLWFPYFASTFLFSAREFVEGSPKLSITSSLLASCVVWEIIAMINTNISAPSLLRFFLNYYSARLILARDRIYFSTTLFSWREFKNSLHIYIYIYIYICVCLYILLGFLFYNWKYTEYKYDLFERTETNTNDIA